MIKVGITGGIGSGKSLICKVFSKLGVPVYNADDSSQVSDGTQCRNQKGFDFCFW